MVNFFNFYYYGAGFLIKKSTGLFLGAILVVSFMYNK
jgi:hypothetical protein